MALGAPLTRHWPLFGLRVRTPILELRYPDDELVAALADLAAHGIHDPTTMPFGVPWTDAHPGDLERNSLQHYWECRGSWTAASWRAQFAVLVDGQPVGVQGLWADDFPALGKFESGSWLGRAYQGQGLGTEMRAAMLHLAFAGLGAALAVTSAWEDNAASLAVTERSGYEPNGEDLRLRRGVPTRLLLFRLERPRWEQRRRHDIEILGLEECRTMFTGPKSTDG